MRHSLRVLAIGWCLQISIPVSISCAQVGDSLAPRLQALAALAQRAVAAQQQSQAAATLQATAYSDHVDSLNDRLQGQVKVLADRVAGLETSSQRDSVSKAEALKVSYDVGNQVLTQIIGATRTVTFTERLLVTEVEISHVTNPWSNQQFRNSWDKVHDWGMLSGLAAAGLAAFVRRNHSDQSTYLGGGLLLSGVSKFFGNTFGSTTKKNFEDMTDFVEFTRRAYDDLHARNDLLNGYITRNETKLAELESFQTREYALAPTDSAKAAALIKLDPHLDDFRTTLDQISSVLTLYDTLVSKYTRAQGDSIAVPRLRDPNLISALEGIRVQVAKLHSDYTAVRRFLDVAPTLREALFRWRLPAPVVTTAPNPRPKA